MRILALETATETCSVALMIDGEILERVEQSPRMHATLLLPWVEALLNEAGATLQSLDAIAVSHGPGSFTGIRIGFSAAQGLAYGAQVGLIGCSTLEVLAAATDTSAERILCVLDARMGEYYVGGYQRADAGWVVALPDQVVAPDALVLPEGPWFAAGPGGDAYDGALERRFGDRLTGIDTAAIPTARALLQLAARNLERGDVPAPAITAAPVYLRNRVATPPA